MHKSNNNHRTVTVQKCLRFGVCAFLFFLTLKHRGMREGKNGVLLNSYHPTTTLIAQNLTIEGSLTAACLLVF